MNAMTLFSANRNVIDNICSKHLKGLYKQGSGGLSVYIKVTPHADHVVIADGFIDDRDCPFNIWKWRRRNFIGMQKCAGGVRSQNPASDESLRDEGMQVQVRE